jgi:AcrR family transcriptional regulator
LTDSVGQLFWGMARTRPTDRFPQLISAAADIFIAQGYQRTQMQDVADRLGVAKGTVYGYVESKAALLGAALRYADGIEPPPSPDELPIRAPADGELAAMVTDRLRDEASTLLLTRALTEPRGDRDELQHVVEDLYHRLARHRVSIKIIDRCAVELPDLAEVWFGLGRRGQVAALSEYLQRHTDTLHLPGPTPVIARTILETCVLWAVHLHWDPAGTQPDADPAIVAATIAGLFTHGLRAAQET